ncbi:MAG: hypothetical protein BYD32DRAFT_221745 [Podila humilis]|nr:MAG: hypothetical protein BYD32DRAFT_221745 [Podila humilis]
MGVMIWISGWSKLLIHPLACLLFFVRDTKHSGPSTQCPFECCYSMAKQCSIHVYLSLQVLSFFTRCECTWAYFAFFVHPLFTPLHSTQWWTPQVAPTHYTTIGGEYWLILIAATHSLTY